MLYLCVWECHHLFLHAGYIMWILKTIWFAVLERQQQHGYSIRRSITGHHVNNVLKQFIIAWLGIRKSSNNDSACEASYLKVTQFNKTVRSEYAITIVLVAALTQGITTVVNQSWIHCTSNVECSWKMVGAGVNWNHRCARLWQTQLGMLGCLRRNNWIINRCKNGWLEQHKI